MPKIFLSKAGNDCECDMIYAEILLTARHTGGYGDLSMRHPPAFVCSTMRHTPAFVFVHRFAIGTATGSSFSPLREGMGCRIVLIINKSLPRHPLSERGEGTASGRSDSEAVNKNEGRGVSHWQTSTS